MFLRRLSLQNFKSAAEAELELAQLTLLVGTNSAGKSTILQALLLQTQAVESGAGGRLYPLNGSRVSLGDFVDVLWSGALETPESQVIVGGELEIYADDLGAERYPVATLPGWSWRMSFGDPGMESASAMRLVASRVWSRDDAFSVSATLGYEEANRRDLLESSGVASDVGDWLLDVVGEINISHEDVSESVAGVQIVAGLPNRVLVERAASELVAAAWVEVMDRVIRAELNRRRRETVPSHRELSDLANLERRLNQARDSGDSMLVSQLERRISDLRSRGTDQARSALIEDLFEAQEKAVELERWAREDIARLIDEGVPVGAAKEWFSRYYMERRRRRSLPDFSAVRTADLEVAAQVASLELVSGTALVSLDESLPDDLPLAANVFHFLQNSIRYLGPLREKPRPLYDQAANPKDGDIGPKGELTAAVIHACRDQQVVNPSLDGPPTRGTLAEALGEWLRYLGLGESIQTVDRGRLGIELTVYQQGANRDLDLTAVGVGVSQTLPVLTLCLLAPPETLILLEQPELHLHPGTQQRLADFLLASGRSGRQLIVETHSDHIVSRLRRRIAEDPTDETLQSLGIVYAEALDDRTRYRRVEPNEFGAIDEWPAGFFDQTLKESQEILRAAIAKKKERSGSLGAEEAPA
jgi:predicted ATPase